MIALLDRVRSHQAIAVHGPEHHAMVPGIIVSTYRNLGGAATDEDIRTAIRRGAKIVGGFCGFMGACGGAIGTGIAFGVLIKSNPVKGHERRIVQSVTQAALAKIASLVSFGLS